MARRRRMRNGRVARASRSIADWLATATSFVVLGTVLGLLCIPIVRITRRAAQASIAEEAPEPT